MRAHMQLVELYDVTFSHFDTYKVFTGIPEHNSIILAE